MHLPNRDARRLFLHLHGLAESPNRRLDPAGLMRVIEGIGFVQVDSIATVERAHHMILHARSQSYRPADLDRLLERDRLLFENWTHDASIIPVAFYPQWKPRFARARARLADRWAGWQGREYEAELSRVLAHVTAQGETTAADLMTERRGNAGAWWGWHPEKTALEYLWRTGDLAISRRESFRKIYDLPERVLPDHHHLAAPDHDAWVDWACSGALDRLGFATPGELAAFWEAVSPEEAKDWVARNRDALEVVEFGTADGSGRHVFARPGLAERAAAAPEPPPRIRVLSPFDPALRDRNRALRLFGFDYRIEIYVPAHKRKYGYYVFPLLEGDRVVGRIDMKARRAEGRLHVTALWPEQGLRFSGGRLARLEAELTRVARFSGCGEVTWEPGWLRLP
ncbi:winged helix-turn-helix domain-containing protein [Paroceanicella profunda]|uniref:winged helix-turn-helix domain-containing protein n=1 Tax=Paroceanicella profunda TaxID=2579971 RepID=UPI0014792961|nr:crosslink repair DNA glycosylase YcaQ family protein [Paroceanicella profunda]